MMSADVMMSAPGLKMTGNQLAADAFGLQH